MSETTTSLIAEYNQSAAKIDLPQVSEAVPLKHQRNLVLLSIGEKCLELDSADDSFRIRKAWSTFFEG